MIAPQTAAPQLSLVKSPLSTQDVDVIVIGTFQGEQEVGLVAVDDIDIALNGTLLARLTTLGATGKAQEIIKLPGEAPIVAPLIVAVGLGKPAEDGSFTDEQVRVASGVAARALAGKTSAASALSTLRLGPTVEGSLLGAYQFTSYKSSPGDRPVGALKVLAPTQGAIEQHRLAFEAASAIAEAVKTARDLINTPPNLLYPESFADRISGLAKKYDLDIEVLAEKELRKDGYGGILAVGMGSARPPRLIKLSYRHPKARKKIALVGKGITFDTGGISIKPAANMEEMTADMSGAAVVAATVALTRTLNVPLEVTGWLAMAENMPSGSAYRPGDVITIYGGKTVEILNTDAEGRMVLADAIVRASEEGPDYLVDVATLTGAQVVALGKRTAAVLGSDDLRDRIARLGRAVGEPAWAMPLLDEIRELLDSRVADIANVSSTRTAGVIVGAVFLQEFVPAGLPWAHLDIAGPAFHPGSPYGYVSKGATGMPTRTLAALLADIAENN